jgi:WD40 repeat protein
MIGKLTKKRKAAITTTPTITPDPRFTFRGHIGNVNAVAVFPDGRRIVTASDDKTIRLWNLEDGVVLKKMEGHGGQVQAVAVSGDGQLIASGDEYGELMAWHGETGKTLTKAVKGHSSRIRSLDFSPDGVVLATGSYDGRTKLWSTKTWMEQLEGNQIISIAKVNCVRFSPSGEFLAIAAENGIGIWDSSTHVRGNASRN